MFYYAAPKKENKIKTISVSAYHIDEHVEEIKYSSIKLYNLPSFKNHNSQQLQ